MTDLSEDHSLSKASLDPAADAAAMLLRLGFAIFALLVPSTSILSRWVIVVLVPIGAVLIILSGLLRGDPLRAGRALLDRLSTFAGLAALLLALWAVLSLAWAPQAAGAAGKLVKIFGMALLTALAVESLPLRMRASNLHLVTIGVAASAVLMVSALLGDLTGFWFIKVASLAPGRSALLLLCLGWSAGAWLFIKNRRTPALVLGVMIALVAVLDPSREVLAPAGVALLVFAFAWAMPERAGRWVGLAAAAVIALAPLLALLAKALGRARPGGWWDMVTLDPLRALTGRGFEAVSLAREKGFLADDLPYSFVTDVWFDLGVIGALGLAWLVYAMFRLAGQLGLEVAPLALAGLGAAFTYALLERGSTQTWWMNAMAVFAIVLASVQRGRYRTVRPRAALTSEPLTPEAATLPESLTPNASR